MPECRRWGREQRTVGFRSCHCCMPTRHFKHENIGHCTSVGTCQVKKFGCQKTENTVLCWLESQGMLAQWYHLSRVLPACSILLPCTGTSSLLRPFFYKLDDWSFPRWNIQWQDRKFPVAGALKGSTASDVCFSRHKDFPLSPTAFCCS